MPKDFAGRNRSKARQPARRPAARRASPRQRVLFHGPSFSSGALVGGLIVVLAAYAPELMRNPGEDAQPEVTELASKPAVEFEFPRLLRELEVKPDPEPYAVPEPDRSAEPAVYAIQAASFRDRTDAEQLRARLLLSDLPARVDPSSVGGSTWFRVSVGPFGRKVEADRAMTRLREQGLSAIWINHQN